MIIEKHKFLWPYFLNKAIFLGRLSVNPSFDSNFFSLIAFFYAGLLLSYYKITILIVIYLVQLTIYMTA